MSMKFGRIAYNGGIHRVQPAGAGFIRVLDGTFKGLELAEDSVLWLPPVQANTIFALGLNYADHAKELDFKPPEQPLVFLKGSNTLVGHRSQTPRPADAEYMHYECELAVVIGRHARNVPREAALEYVAGYTVADDYAIRDYLENYYRPNLRVKNRDACTPIGPWFVPASEVPDPMNLTLTTHVNGVETQHGNTRDMVFDVAWLVSYLSNIMTLSPFDLILTGTPKGLVNVVAGDEVVTEIEHVGRLVNTLFTPDF